MPAATVLTTPGQWHLPAAPAVSLPMNCFEIRGGPPVTGHGAICTWPGCATVSVASKAIHFSMYFTECFVFRNFRFFLHHCEPHVRPWLLDMRLATVCRSIYGPVYSICTQKPQPIWA